MKGGLEEGVDRQVDVQSKQKQRLRKGSLNDDGREISNSKSGAGRRGKDEL